jgi:hypothetical protein
MAARDLGRNARNTCGGNSPSQIVESAVKGKLGWSSQQRHLGSAQMIGGGQPSHALIGCCTRPWIDIPLVVKGSSFEKQEPLTSSARDPSRITQT